ncbi:MAG: vanadium-dependent haloperoxidase [Oligoflexales bacterium]|nr:vanadium-dependent haloperoxidase [Oligoflexales bacterium]
MPKSYVYKLNTQLSIITLLFSTILIWSSLVSAAGNENSANAEKTALAWYATALELVKTTPGNSPPVVSRLFGYMGLVLHETVGYSTPASQTLLAKLNDAPEIRRPQSEQIHLDTAINQAMSHLLLRFFAANSFENKFKIISLRQQLEDAMTLEITALNYAYSKAWGVHVADQVFSWSQKDAENADIQAAEFFNSRDAHYAGAWEATLPDFAPALLPSWGWRRSFVPQSTESCTIEAPPAFSWDKGSDFYKEAEAVYSTSLELTSEQKAIAQFWADGAGKTATPPGHWISIAIAVLAKEKTDIEKASEVLARLGIGLADSFISCWRAKYEYNLMRPITYIRKTIDANWMSFITTPPFPEYVSGHSVQSAAAALVLSHFFGTSYSFTDSTHEIIGLQSRHFASFDAAAKEAAISRLYGGIHFPVGIENGLKQGECIGNKVLAL